MESRGGPVRLKSAIVALSCQAGYWPAPVMITDSYHSYCKLVLDTKGACGHSDMASRLAGMV